MARLNSKRQIITDIHPKSHISEAYRTLRTNIQFSNIDEQIQTIMVTSAGPGEGKSTTSSNLAVTYAQSEKNTLLIDCDLRKPTAHRTFMLSNRWGVSNLLAQLCDIDDVIQPTYIPGLSVIPSGPVPPNPSEMLGSKRMTSLLEELKARYDMIIIDSPPTLAVTDAQIIASKCDGVLLVLDSGRVKRDAAIKMKSNLERVNAKILGVVLNNIKRKQGEEYYYYYYGETES